jgi:hypothetical protein
MLYHFLLVYPTGFKGVLTTYQIQLSSYFSHGVFGGEILKMKNFKMIEFIKDSVVYKGIIINVQEHSQDYAGSLLKIIHDILKNGVVQGGVLGIISFRIKLIVAVRICPPP